MATDPATIEFLIDQLGRRGARFTTKRMFGEYCVYRDGLPVAFVCDDVLFVKDTPAGRAAIEAGAPLEFGPPYPGAKLYPKLAPDTWDDRDWLRRVLDETAAALPAPKPKRPKRSAADGNTAAGSRAGSPADVKRRASGANASPATAAKRKAPKPPGEKS
jgi:TfoX/Sxy family transcriptional regulator of competence genes